MQTRQIQVGDLAITIHESQGTGPSALFIHGNSANGLTFKEQLEGPLGQKYRIVAVDLPGHGTSSRASKPEEVYHMPGYAKVVTGVAEQLDLTDAVLVGWSLGGHIALEAAKFFPQSRGIMIWGTPPVGIPPVLEEAFLPNPSMAAAFANELTPEQIAAFGEACLKPGAKPDAEFFEAFAQTDGLARATMGGSVATANYEDEVQIVKNLDKPLAILQGEYEQLVNLDYLKALEAPTLWRGEVQVITGAGHSPQFETPAEFDALVDAFLEDTSNK